MRSLRIKGVMPTWILSKNQFASSTEFSELHALYVIQIGRYFSKVNEPIFFLEKSSNPQLFKIIEF